MAAVLGSLDSIRYAIKRENQMLESELDKKKKDHPDLLNHKSRPYQTPQQFN